MKYFVRALCGHAASQIASSAAGTAKTEQLDWLTCCLLACRGSELLREVAWVIFDEVHYMQDRERGVVWEEAIIFLPKGVRMVFLSATLSNASEFAGWVCHLHKQPCHVVYTDFRPTPLQHYAFPVGGSGLYLVSVMPLSGVLHFPVSCETRTWLTAQANV